MLDQNGIEAHRAHPTKPKHYQVIGERSSGTNFVSELIRLNTDLIPCERFGWKHSIPNPLFIARDTLPVVVFRDPFSWLLSLHRKPWHATAAIQRLAFSDFIRTPWETEIDDELLSHDFNNRLRHERADWLCLSLFWNRLISKPWSRMGLPVKPLGFSQDMRAVVDGLPIQADRHPVTGEVFANPMRLRTIKAMGFLNLRRRGCHYVLAQYEKIAAAPEAFLDTLGTVFGARRSPTFRPINRTLGDRSAGWAPGRPPTPAVISPEDRAFIVSELDPAVELALGYNFSAEAN